MSELERINFHAGIVNGLFPFVDRNGGVHGWCVYVGVYVLGESSKINPRPVGGDGLKLGAYRDWLTSFHCLLRTVS